MRTDQTQFVTSQSTHSSNIRAEKNRTSSYLGIERAAGPLPRRMEITRNFALQCGKQARSGACEPTRRSIRRRYPVNRGTTTSQICSISKSFFYGSVLRYFNLIGPRTVNPVPRTSNATLLVVFGRPFDTRAGVIFAKRASRSLVRSFFLRAIRGHLVCVGCSPCWVWCYKLKIVRGGIMFRNSRGGRSTDSLLPTSGNGRGGGGGIYGGARGTRQSLSKSFIATIAWVLVSLL